MKRFDRKFGGDLIDSLPRTPAVYLFKDQKSQVLYVGKAKNIRRRLSDYRNASRRKVHRKMRTLVREASALEVRLQPSEQHALSLENELIQTLRPPYNIEGAYSFLYPAIGFEHSPQRTLLCFTTRTDAWDQFGFRWFGVFRSRRRARDAFDTLAELLARLGHLERVALLGAPRIKGSRIVGIRQLDRSVVSAVEEFLSGCPGTALGVISRALLDKPRARREASDVQAQLRSLAAFHRTDLARLHDALRTVGRSGSFVSQRERDVLFIEAEPAR
jgi:predicted GIY-YIG superfamily endonuclease